VIGWEESNRNRLSLICVNGSQFTKWRLAHVLELEPGRLKPKGRQLP
jgi:hypothetical protein